MVLTRTAAPLVRPEQKVRHLALDESGDTVAWVEGGRTVFLAKLDGTCRASTVSTFETEHAVSCLVFHRSRLVVGDDLASLSFYDLEGNMLEKQDIDGGVQACHVMGLRLAVLSGMGEVFLAQFEREPQNLSRHHDLGDVVHLTVHADRVFVAEQGGQVLSMTASEVLWRRQARGEHGERITGIGSTSNGRLFLTREGHALVAGDEEAIEFELWNHGALVCRIDVSKRLLTSSPASEGAVLGFDDGSVCRLSEDGVMETAFETAYPVFSCLEHGAHLVASSWFYIHGEANGGVWKIEHQGMPQMLCLHAEKSLLVFAGDDQNDYTSPEPIGIVDLKEMAYTVDDADLSAWFQMQNSKPPPTAEELYAKSDDVYNLLSDDERASMANPEGIEVSSDVLLAALEVEPMPSEVPAAIIDEDDLLLALENNESLSDEESEQLMDALNASVSEVIPPRAIAGDDQRHTAEDDGTCLVLLDGRGSFDPQGRIVGWSWHDARGQELSASAQLRLKLPVGNHRFELRVVDSEGSWTTDSLSVHILDGLTS